MIRKAIGIGLTLLVLGFVSSPNAHADDWNKKTVLTFSQPVEIAGHVLPAGTYTFQLADSMSDRHIVQIFNADATQILATVMSIPDYRLAPTDQTVVKFGEVPAGSPEAIRAWFYPGNSVGQEFVYPKLRAIQLAKASNVAVPAMPDDVVSADALRTAPISAVTPDANETTVIAAIQTTAPEPTPAAQTPPLPPTPAVQTPPLPPMPAAQTPPLPPMPAAQTPPLPPTPVVQTPPLPPLPVVQPPAPPAVPMPVGTSGVVQTDQATPTGELPKTASALPLIVALGLGSIGVAFGLMLFGKHAAPAA